MKIPSDIKFYGDINFRGDCPSEAAEQMAFFGILRREFPEYAKVAIHPKNEGKRSGKMFQQLAKDKAMGLVAGASDIVMPCGFVCELKRKDHTKSVWQDGQQEYLRASAKLGAFACVALGHEAAIDALKDFIKTTCKHKTA